MFVYVESNVGAVTGAQSDAPTGLCKSHPARVKRNNAFRHNFEGVAPQILHSAIASLEDDTCGVGRNDRAQRSNIGFETGAQSDAPTEFARTFRLLTAHRRRDRRPRLSVVMGFCYQNGYSEPSPAEKGDRLRWMRRTRLVQTPPSLVTHTPDPSLRYCSTRG